MVVYISFQLNCRGPIGGREHLRRRIIGGYGLGKARVDIRERARRSKLWECGLRIAKRTPARSVVDLSISKPGPLSRAIVC